MQPIDSTVGRWRRRLLALLVAAAGVGGWFLPVAPGQVAELRTISRDIAVAVVTITAIWLGMMFGVALKRAEGGERNGGSLLIKELMRPLTVGAVTLLAAVLVEALGAQLAALAGVLPAEWQGGLTQLPLILSLLLCAGATYGLLLALAPVTHVIEMLQSVERGADQQPRADPDDDKVVAGWRPDSKDSWTGG